MGRGDRETRGRALRGTFSASPYLRVFPAKLRASEIFPTGRFRLGTFSHLGNYVVNAAHPGMSDLEVVEVAPLLLDNRVLARIGAEEE